MLDLRPCTHDVWDICIVWRGAPPRIFANGDAGVFVDFGIAQRGGGFECQRDAGCRRFMDRIEFGVCDVEHKHVCLGQRAGFAHILYCRRIECELERVVCRVLS